MRPRVLHAVRDPGRHGGRVRGLPRAGVLLRPPGPSRRRAAARRPAPRAGVGDWWARYFDAQYLLEYEPIFDAAQDRREVARLVDLLALPVAARVLDVPCGQGRHARLLAEAGYRVDAIDYSRYLLERARAEDHGAPVAYRRADMRRLPARWTGRFDAVVNLFTSFGFFTEPADDARVIAEFARVLAPGGTLVWHGGSRDGVMARFIGKDWWTTRDGTVVAHERRFDPLSGVLTIRSTFRGPAGDGEREHRIRLYTATRLAELMAAHGLVVEQAFDGWHDRALRRVSGEMLLVARKGG